VGHDRRRVTIDHEHPKAAKARDDVFGHAVAQMGEAGLAAHVVEGQHGNRWAVGGSLVLGLRGRRGQAICEDVAVDLLRPGVRRQAEILSQGVAAGCVEFQRLRVLALAGMEAHQRAIDGLAQVVAGEQVAAQSHRLVARGGGEGELLQHAHREAAQVFTLGTQPFVELDALP
jgi:hypothetical protein